ncbi:MAG: hypothetical protein LBI14_10050 [Treponema sp.]|jgi:hypothetical protein|nr:hypothetical protein [Treponema sp.]
MKVSINRYISLSLISVILAAVLISCGSNPPSQTSTSRSFQDGFEARQNAYMSFLRQEGYEPSIDSDGDIKFMYQGDIYYIVIDHDDPSFFFVFLFCSWTVYSNEEWQSLLIATSNANRNTKVAKAFLVGEDGNEVFMYISAELFLENPNDIRVVFPRMIDAINFVWDSLVDELS